MTNLENKKKEHKGIGLWAVFLLLFFCAFSSSTYAQSSIAISPASNPDTIVPSGDPVKFKVSITNTDVDNPTAVGWKLKVVSTPRWEINTASSGTALILLSRVGDTYFYGLPVIASEKSITVTFNVTPKCGIIPGQDKFLYTVYDASDNPKSDLDRATGSIANIYYPIMSFDPAASTTVRLNTDATRVMKIIQTQESSYASQIKVEHLVDNTTLTVRGVEVSIDNNTWVAVPAPKIITESGKYTYNFDTSVLSSLGLANDRLGYNQTLYFRETIRYIACYGDGVSSYTITYGKNDEFCSTTSTGVAQVITSAASFSPNIIQQGADATEKYTNPDRDANGYYPGTMRVRALNNSGDTTAIMKDIIIPAFHGDNRNRLYGYNLYITKRAYLIDENGNAISGSAAPNDTIFIPVQNNRSDITGFGGTSSTQKNATYYLSFDAMDAATNAKIAYARAVPGNSLDLADLDGDGMYNDLPPQGKGVSVAIEFINDYSILTPCVSQLRGGTISYAYIVWKNTCDEYERFIQAYVTSQGAESTQICRYRWFFPALRESKTMPNNVNVGDQVVLRVQENVSTGTSNGGELTKLNNVYEHFVEITLPEGFEWEPGDPNSKIKIGAGAAEVPTFTVDPADITYDAPSKTLRIQRRAVSPAFHADQQYYDVTVRVAAAAETAVRPNKTFIKHSVRLGGATGQEYFYSCSDVMTAYNISVTCSNFELKDFTMKRATFGFKSTTDQTPLTPAEQSTKNLDIAFAYDKVVVGGEADVIGAINQTSTNKLIATFSYTRDNAIGYFDKQSAQVKVIRGGTPYVYSLDNSKITQSYISLTKTHVLSVDCQSIGNLQAADEVSLELTMLTRGDVPSNMITNIPDIKFQWTEVNNGIVPNCNISLKTDFQLRNNRKAGIANSSDGNTYNIAAGFARTSGTDINAVSNLFVATSYINSSASTFNNVEARPNFQVISDTVVYKVSGLIKVKRLENRFFGTVLLQEGLDYSVSYTPTQTEIKILHPRSINDGYSSMGTTYIDYYYINFDHIHYPNSLRVEEYARIIDLPTSENPLERTTNYSLNLSRVVFDYDYNLSSSTPQAEPLTNRAEWPLTVSNLSAWGGSYDNDTLHHSWIGVEDPSGTLNDFQLVYDKDGTTYTPQPYTSLDGGSTYYWFKIGNLKASAENFTLSARYTTCSSRVSFNVKYSCGKGDYPFDPVRGFQQYGGSSYKNKEKTTTLFLLPPKGAVSGSLAIVSAPQDPAKPGIYDMCDPICYKATMSSAMQSSLYNPILVVRKGDGVVWDSSIAPTATYDGSPITGAITVKETIDSISFILPNTVEIEGYTSGKKLEIEFCLLLGDGFVANTSTYAYLRAESGCGERFSFLANSSNVKIHGMPENMPIYSMINFEASDLRYSANGEGTMTLTGIYNILQNGVDGASSFIILPENLRLISGTLTSGSFTSNYIAGRDQRIIKAPFGNDPSQHANGVEYAVNLNLRATSPGTWSCRTDSIHTSSGVETKIFCSRGTFTISQMSDVSQVQEFEVSKLELEFNTLNTNIVGEYYSPTQEKVTITASLNNNSSTGSGALKVELYLDNDSDGVLSFGDGPVLGNPFIGISNIGGYDNQEITRSFIVNSDDVCKLMLVIRQDANPYICNTVSCRPAKKDYKLPETDYIICQGSDITIGTENMDGYTYRWTPISHISNPNIANPVFKYENAIVTQQKLTYFLTIVRKDGCDVIKQIDLTVNPLPHLNVPLDLDTICTGGVAYSEIATATPGNVTFEWFRPSVMGINSGAAATGNGAMLLDILNNTSNEVKTVKYIYTTTINGCSAKDTLTICVFGQASIGNISTPAGVCEGSKLTLVVPSIRTGGADIVSQGWELDGNPFNPATSLTLLDNGKLLRYVITTGCGEFSSNEVPVTVNPIPSLSSATTEALCSDETLTYTITSPESGVSYTWTRAANPAINGNAGKSGSGALITEKLVSTSNAPVDVVYTITMSAKGCTDTEALTVTVNPKPVLDNIPLTTSICSGDSYVYNAPTSNVAGATITWERLDAVGIDEPGKAGSGNIDEPLTNNTTSAITVTYEFTLRANGCVNTQLVKVTVNPSPVLTSNLYPADICSGETFNYTARTSIRNATFSWTRNTPAGITGGATSGLTPTLNQPLINSTAAPIPVEFEITIESASGCKTIETIEVLVNPTPKVTAGTLNPGQKCSGEYFVHTITSDTERASFTWIRQDNSQIEEAISNGVGSLISEKLTVKEGVNTPVVVKYTITTEANGCTNSGEELSFTVNPLPTLSVDKSPVALAANGTTEITAYTNGTITGWTSTNTNVVTVTSITGDDSKVMLAGVSTGTAYVTVTTQNTYGCTNSLRILVNVGAKNTAAISLASGYPSQICNGGSTDLSIDIVGGEAPFTVVYGVKIGAVAEVTQTLSGSYASGRVTVSPANTTNAVTSAVYRLISITDANGQSIDPLTNSVTIAVNPEAEVTNVFSPITVCENAMVSTTIFTSNVNGVTYEWTNDNPAINLAMSGTGNIPAFIAKNGQGTTITATITVRAVVSTGSLHCTGQEESFTITVNPQPTFSVIPPNPICGGSSHTFSQANDVTGVIPATSTVKFYSDYTCQNEITTVTPSQTTTYYVKAESSDNCTSAVQEIILTVYPKPELNSELAATICSGERFEYTATTPLTSGVSYSWSRAVVAGISNLASSGNSSSIRETLVNTTNAPIDVTYVFTTKANGCTNTQDVVVTVNPRPKLATTPLVTFICSGDVFTYTPTFNIAGITYSWTRSYINGIDEAEISANDVGINETLTNSSYNPITVRYTITMEAPGGCINTEEVKIEVAPAPSLSTTLYPNPICSGSTFSYTARSRTSGVTFSWSRLANANISEPASAGNAGEIIVETLTNTSTMTETVEYEIKMELANGCFMTEIVEVTVYPSPTISSDLLDETICSGEYFTYQIESATPGVSYTWKRAKVAGISQVQGFGTQPYINEILTNKTDNPIDVIYEMSIEANGCITTGITKKVIVNPTPTVSISNASPLALNEGGVEAINVVTGVNVNVIGWESSNPAVAEVNASGVVTAKSKGTAVITVTVENQEGCRNFANIAVNVGAAPTAILSLASGAASEVCDGSSSTIEATITGGAAPYSITYSDGTNSYTSTAYTSPHKILVTPPANTTNAPADVTYTLTSVTYGSSNTAITTMGSAVITVNPTAEITNVLSNVIACEGSTVSMLTFTTNIADATKVIYEWTNDNPSIGLAMSGRTLVPAFLATNNLGVTTSANITVTPIYVGTVSCAGTPRTYTITVNPKPTFTPAYLTAICAGETHTFSSADVLGINPPGSTVKFYEDRTCNIEVVAPVSPAQSTYYYVRATSLDGCLSSVQEIYLPINPLPSLSSAKTIDICSGEEFAYTATSPQTGVAYEWTRASVAGVTNSARTDVNGANIKEVLELNTNTSVEVIYSIKMTANACSKIDTVKVTVYPKPELNNIPTTTAICSGAKYEYLSPASDVASASIRWERQPVNGIAEGMNNGSGNIDEVLTNTTSNAVLVTYVFTLQADGCPNTQTVSVTVYPAPELTSLLHIDPICNGGSINYMARTSSKNIDFSWSRATIAGINGGAIGSGTGAVINEMLTNSTIAPITVRYEITMTVRGTTCSTSEIVEIVVNPTPVIESKVIAPICSGENFTYDITSATENANFMWIRQKNTQIKESPTTAASSMISEFLTLKPGVSVPVTVDYVIFTDANGCRNAGETISVVVNPLPEVSITSPTPVTMAVNNTKIVNAFTTGTVIGWSSSNIGVVEVTQDLIDPTKAELEGKAEGVATITLEVTNAAGCYNTVSFTVNINAEYTATMSLASNASSQLCNGDNTTLQMEITGGKAPFKVLYSTDGGTTTTTISINSSNGKFVVTPLLNTTNDVEVTTYELISVEDTDGQAVRVITSKVDIEVNPTAKITNQAALVSTVCEGSIMSVDQFVTNVINTNRVSYTWFNDNPSIGLSVTGIGHVPTFRAENGTGKTITANITAIATYRGITSCQDLNEEISFTITVYPKPDFVVINPEAICAGTPIDLNAKANDILNDITPNVLTNTIEFFSSRSCDPLTKVTSVTPLFTTIYYARVTSVDGCVSAVKEVVVTVNTVPTADQIQDQIVCNNTGMNIQLTGMLQGTTYEWARIDTETNITGLVASGTNVVYSSRLGNTTTDPKTAIIEVTPKFTANGVTCTGAVMTFNITVNPTPVLNVALKAPGICSGNSPQYDLTSSTPGAIISWERLDSESIAEASQVVTSNKIDETLTNLTQKTVNVRYVVTIEIDGCSNMQYITVPVYPIPELTSALHAGQICSGENFVYQSTTAVSGAVMTWRRVANGSITEVPAGVFAAMPISETLTNTTVDPVVVQYEVKTEANGCERTEIVEVIVGPELLLTSTNYIGILCSGEPITYIATSSSSNIQYTWKRKFNVNIEPMQASGVGATINEVLYNTSNARETVEYIITMMTSNNCIAEHTVTVEVCAIPDITISETSVTIAAGATRNLYVTDRHAQNASVISSNPLIATASFDDTTMELTVNALQAGYTEITYSTQCDNACYNEIVIPVLVTEGPMGTLAIAGVSTICSGGTTELQLTNIEYGKGPWEVEINYNGGNASSVIAFTINSLMELPKMIDVTPPANNGTTYAIYNYSVTKITDSEGSERTNHMGKPAVTVLPVPTVNPMIDQEVCFGGKNEVVYFSGTATNYKWTVDVPVGIDLIGEGNKLPAYELGHNGSSPVTATITVTPEYTMNGLTCVGAAETFTVEVNPLPSIDAVMNEVSCHESAISIPLTGTNVTEYHYTAASLVGLSSSGVIPFGGSLDFIADNVTSQVVSQDITITPVYRGATKDCYGAPITFTVTVNPKPDVNPVDDMEFCVGVKVDAIEFSGSTPGAIYTWTRVGGDPIIDLSDSGTGKIPSFTAYNLTSSAIVAEYEVLATINNLGNICGDKKETFKITIHPEPVINYTIGNQSYCAGTMTDLISFGATTDITYEWKQTAGYNIGLTPNNGSDEIPSFLVVNNTSFTQIAVIEVTPRVRNTACVGTPMYFNIEVKPTARLTSPIDNGSICSGEMFEYEATSTSNNVYFKWRRLANTDINDGNEKQGQGYTIKETLTNNSLNQVEVQYEFNLEYEGCQSLDTITVMVDPTPVFDFESMNYICWNASEIVVPYTTPQTNIPHMYKLTFTADGHKSGFFDMVNYELLPDELKIQMPATVLPGHYTVEISVKTYSCIKNYVIVLWINDPIVIVEQPQSITGICDEGSILEMSVEATGDGLMYQWYHNGVAIPGADSDIYTIDYVPSMAGEYYVEVSNICETVKSQIAKVVPNEITIELMWDDVLLVDNGKGNYVGYQWYKDDIAIAVDGDHEYYSDPKGLDGKYHVVCFYIDGETVTSCPLYFVYTPESNQIVITPNPADIQGAINVRIDNYEKAQTIEIFDTDGKKISEYEVDDLNTEIKAPYIPGTYIIRVSGQEQKTNQKLIVK